MEHWAKAARMIPDGNHCANLSGPFLLCHFVTAVNDCSLIPYPHYHVCTTRTPVGLIMMMMAIPVSHRFCWYGGIVRETSHHNFIHSWFFAGGFIFMLPFSTARRQSALVPLHTHHLQHTPHRPSAPSLPAGGEGLVLLSVQAIKFLVNLRRVYRRREGIQRRPSYAYCRKATSIRRESENDCLLRTCEVVTTLLLLQHHEQMPPTVYGVQETRVVVMIEIKAYSKHYLLGQKEYTTYHSTHIACCAMQT